MPNRNGLWDLTPNRESSFFNCTVGCFRWELNLRSWRLWSSQNLYHHPKWSIPGRLEASTMIRHPPLLPPCMLQRAQGKGLREHTAPHSVNTFGQSACQQFQNDPASLMVSTVLLKLLWRARNSCLLLCNSPRRGNGCVTSDAWDPRLNTTH